MDGVPLHQILEPGEYRAQWEVPDQSGKTLLLDGDLEIKADRPPRGYVNGDLAAWEAVGEGRHAAFPQVYEAGIVRGKLLNGMTVVLLDTRVSVWISERAILDTPAALVGRDDELAQGNLVAALEVQVRGIDAMSAIAPIARVQLPVSSAGTRYLDWKWGADGNPDSTQVWADENAEVKLKFYSSVSAPEGFFYRVTFSPVVLIKLAEPISLERALDDWIEPLRRIVSLSTGRQEPITYLAAGAAAASDVDHQPFQVFGSGVQQQPFASRANDIRTIHRSFQVSPQEMSLLDLLRAWQRLGDEHHPLLETYGDMMYAPQQHPRSQVLLLLQALEGLHGHETQGKYATRSATHTTERDSAILELTGKISAAAMRFIKSNLARRPATSLDQVLRETIAGLPKDLTPEIAATRLVVAAMSDPRKPNSSYDALRIIRNDLAHGSRGYPAADIDQVARLLDRVVRAQLLRLLDCPDKVVERELDRDR